MYSQQTKTSDNNNGYSPAATSNSALSLQCKLTVGAVNDPLEAEADAMADKVMRMPDTPLVQRKCAGCEEEEKQLQRKPLAASITPFIQAKGTETSAASDSVTQQINATKGGGSNLDSNTKSFMESRFGTDFSDVKIHTSNDAVQMNRELGAQAFTVGNDIYFNNGKYDPESDSGRHLLTHELTHVIQQAGNRESITRKPEDKHDLTSKELSGDATLEKCFDNETVIKKFDKGLSVKKLQDGLIKLGFDLPKFGADSDYGAETENAVKDFQQQAQMSKSEWDGIVGRKTIGLLDRSLRNNTIAKDEDAAVNDFVLKDPKQQLEDKACEGKPKDEPCNSEQHKDIDSTADTVTQLINKVLNEQLPPVKKGKTDYPTIFSLLFRFNDNRIVSETANEVKTNFESINNFVGILKNDKTHARCATKCDGGCRSGSPAYHQKNNAGLHIISFCPDFHKSTDKDLVLLHECHHAAIKGSRDIAYPFTRLVEKLDHNKALLNAASFHLYAGMVDNPSRVTIGPDVKDKNTIQDNDAMKKVDLALAFMDQWFPLVTFDMSQTATEMAEANSKGYYSPRANLDIVNIYHNWFETTRSDTKPNSKDVTKAKAIEERSVLMKKAFKKPFNIQETNDSSSWERGPGTEIKLNKQLLNLDIKHLIIGLLQELVHATPDISAESESLYVGTINDIRNRRKLDP